MGWAARHMSEEERKELARSLFHVTEEAGEWLNGLCPMHEDKNPSFGYNFRQDFFKCLANCQDSGDLVKLYALVHGLQNDQAFRELAARYGKPGDGDRSRGGKKHRRERKAEDILSASPRGPVPDHFRHGDALGPIIPESVWQRMAPLPEQVLEELQRSRGWTRDVVRRMDLRLQTVLRQPDSQGDGLRDIRQPQRVAIPVRDAEGRLRNIRLYRLPGVNLQKKIISWGRGYGSARLFPPAPLASSQPASPCCSAKASRTPSARSLRVSAPSRRPPRPRAGLLSTRPPSRGATSSSATMRTRQGSSTPWPQPAKSYTWPALCAFCNGRISWAGSQMAPGLRIMARI